MEYRGFAEREKCIDKIIDEVVETPRGLKFKNHFNSKDGSAAGWYVLY